MAEVERGALAVIGYQPEAYGTLPRHLQMLKPYADEQGFTVTAVPYDGEPFDAEVLEVRGSEVVLAPWDDALDRGDVTKARAWDLYDELERIEVT